MEELLNQINQWDQQLVLAAHDLGRPLLNDLMLGITEKYNWIPLYALLLYLLVRNYCLQALYSVISVVLVIILADHFTSSFMKPFFGRLRPCHDPAIGHLIVVLEKCGGQFGFASSHAANSFAVTSFFWYTFKKQYRWLPLLFIWPLVVSYSRMYLGVHYLTDISVGALVGWLIGYLVFRGTQWAARKYSFAFLTRN